MSEGADELAAWRAADARAVLGFVGYSGAGYEDPDAMLAAAAQVLELHDPARTVVAIGATADGIGAVYPLARERGFTTIGIVSSVARDEGAAYSAEVDRVFVIRDTGWGGVDARTGELSPVSAAIVGASDTLVGIGGGEVAGDELVAARRAGKPVEFIPADMNHAAAIAKAGKRGEAPPLDFRGAAHAALEREGGP